MLVIKTRQSFIKFKRKLCSILQGFQVMQPDFLMHSVFQAPYKNVYNFSILCILIYSTIQYNTIQFKCMHITIYELSLLQGFQPVLCICLLIYNCISTTDFNAVQVLGTAARLLKLAICYHCSVLTHNNDTVSCVHCFTSVPFESNQHTEKQNSTPSSYSSTL